MTKNTTTKLVSTSVDKQSVNQLRITFNNILNNKRLNHKRLQARAVSPRIIFSFVTLVLIWSLTPLSVVWSVREIHPIWSLVMRFVLAAPLATIVMYFMGLKLVTTNTALKSYMAGAIGIFGAMTLCYISAQYVESAIISMIFGTSPLFAGLVSAYKKENTLTIMQWLSMAVAFVGMVLALGLGKTHSSSAQAFNIGVLLLVIAVMLTVASLFSVKKVNAQLHPLTQTTGSLWASAIGLMVLSPFFITHIPKQLPSFHTVIALAFSIIFASVIAFICYFDLIKRVSPTTVSLTTVITPVLATFWGFQLNNEKLGSTVLMGFSLVLLGVLGYLLTGQKK